MNKHGAWIVWLTLSACNGTGDSLPRPYGTITVPTATLASPEARERGRAHFISNCALCHGVRADGRGVRKQGLSGPPANFRSTAWRQRMTPRRVFHAIREGKQGTSMPAWKGFSDSETWDLVAYVLSVSEEAR